MCVRSVSGGHLAFILFLLSSPNPSFGADAPSARNLEEPPELNDLPPLVEMGAATIGYISIEQRNGTGTLDDLSDKTSSWALRGAASRDMGNDWNMQVDGHYGAAKAGLAKAQTKGGAAHVYYRRPSSHAFGGFVETSQLDAQLAELAGGGKTDANAILGGLEGAYFLEQATLYGKAGAGKAIGGEKSAVQIAAAAGARYYINENLRLDIEGDFRRWQADGKTLDTFGASTVANYRLHDSPFAAFAGYRYERTSSDTEPYRSHGLMAGFRYHFGSGSLKDAERNGALW